MKTKLNFLMVFTLLVMLLGASTSPAHAEGGLTISPTTLPDGTYHTSYSQKLTVSGGSGNYSFYVTGNSLPGVGIYTDGKVEGWPEYTGTKTVTAQVVDLDNTSLTGTQEITLTVGPATPEIRVWSVPDLSTSGENFDIWASAGHNQTYPDGTVAFYVDDADNPIPGCEAVPMGTVYGGVFYCEGPADIAGGEHTLKAVYTPSEYWRDFFTSATGTTQHKVGYQITGTLFNDTNQNGVWDDGELANSDWLDATLDKGCDGTMDYTDADLPPDTFAFLYLLPDTYCLSINLSNRFIQTTITGPITLTDANQTINVGVFQPVFVFSPDALPDAQWGSPYSQQFTLASGATAPYTISLRDSSSLPDGMTFDESTDTLSGTPTQTGQFILFLDAQDATGVIAGKSYEFFVHINGTFNLTSSANPSAPGAEVTFTLSATGDGTIPGYGPIPPIGLISFYADGTAIDSCSNLFLNIDPSGPTPGDYPIKCTTSTLSVGSHEITATYTDITSAYSDTTLTLNQQVEITDSTPPAVSVTGVMDGGSYFIGSVPQAGCSSTDAESGVATNATLALSGGDTLGLGSFTATCSGAVDNAGNAASPVSVHYTVLPSADLSITKTDSKDPVKPGAQLVYTLTVINLGPNTAQSVTLTDKLDSSTTYGSVSAPRGWTCRYIANNSTVTCTSTSLAAGSTATIKITVTVKKTATVGKNLVNTAQVSSITYDPNMANNNVTQKTLVSK